MLYSKPRRWERPDEHECKSEFCSRPRLKGKDCCELHETLLEMHCESGAYLRKINKKGEAEILGIIYFIGIRGEQVVKIGKTTGETSAERMAALQTSNHNELYLIAENRVPLSLEKILHSRLSKHRIRGEWFYIRGDVEKVIEAAKSGILELFVDKYDFE